MGIATLRPSARCSSSSPLPGCSIGLLVVALRRVWTAIVGIGFALATMAGFLISVEHGLFGFTDSWAAPFAGLAFTVEIVTVVVLVAAIACCIGSAP